MKIFKKRPVLLLMGIAMSLAISAQSSVTYNHDEAKMNQITVQEIGSGTLTPEFYYKLFHNSYKNTAASKNKLTYRTSVGISAYQQIDDADSIKTCLKKRAEVEALNMADRKGGALDVAWLTEQSKINSKLSDFQANIERIISAGGTTSDKERWTEYFYMFQSAIRITQDAYMPNAQRKKEYLQIYSDINKQNETLISFIVQLNSQCKTSTLLNARSNRTCNKSEFISASCERWHSASQVH